MQAATHESANPPKKKKRTIGAFKCPDCSKVFTRSDHLARHHLNHKPKQVFECSFLIDEFGSRRKCGKTFVRKDLRDRHIKRHFENKVKDHKGSDLGRNGSSEVSSLPLLDESPTGLINHTGIQGGPILDNHNATIHKLNNLDSIISPQYTDTSSIPRYSVPNEGLPPLSSSSLHQLGTKSTYHNGLQNQGDVLSWLFSESPSNRLRNFHVEEANDGKTLHNLFNADNNSDMAEDFPNGIQMMSEKESISTSTSEGSKRDFLGDNSRSLTPFHYFANSNSFQMMNDLQEKNIFLNESNPLDEVFFRSYQSNLSDPFAILDPYFKSTAGANGVMSTISSISPTNTNDLSPHDSISEFLPKDQILNKDQIALHGEKMNNPTNRHIFVNSALVDTLANSLPTMTRQNMSKIFEEDECDVSLEDRFSFYLWAYWSIFHPQFTILHKPSFNTKSAEPLLLLSIILIGSNYTPSKERLEGISPEYEFGLRIADPLRYMIFQHNDFKSPVKLWVLQSLNLLEWSEKNFLLRQMHERAHIHHGTTVQLLKRSPLLGGNPANISKPHSSTPTGASADGEDESSSSDLSNMGDHDTSDFDLFNRWVESESLKRITFMTFYLDIIDYIKFRHAPQIMFHQLQLFSLPCDDENLWESSDVNGSFKKIVKRQRKIQQRWKHIRHEDFFNLHYGEGFLNVLKKLIRAHKSIDSISQWKLSSFAKKILFGGLISIMYQMNQAELQNNFQLLSIGKSRKLLSSKIWKESLAKAMDNWYIVEGSEMADSKVRKSLRILKPGIIPGCHFSIYHLTQIIGISDINHYDIAIFGGSPANMSVAASEKDLQIVQRKLSKIWKGKGGSENLELSKQINFKAVVHCYLLLWEAMLLPFYDTKNTSDSFINWTASTDANDSMYAISIATLVLWSYVFITCGLESNRFNETEIIPPEGSYSKLVKLSAEGGYEYLQRIRSEFLQFFPKDDILRKSIENPSHLRGRNDNFSFMCQYCDVLSRIKHKENISGLCFLIGSKLLNSQWEVIRENAKLILNCGFRSLGRSEVICTNLFEDR
ncbi:uncharacterized protein PRCAT00002632001 [Priceomyces carsonii]|uniref:uncharacterized protein n=1 Tax=Priceomyces carsonii TaxID=28549 RepID=UPI002ED7BE76|nr:unnamed protein product [Priceomyces carsonii]